MAKKIMFLLLLCFGASAQKTAIKVTYQRYSHDKAIENQDPIVAFADANRAIVTTAGNLAGTSLKPSEQFLISDGAITHAALLAEGRYIFTVDSTSVPAQKFELKPERKKILGYDCRKAVTIVNSNTIEIWYTVETGLNIAPTSLGISLGTVLEMVRNGNFAIRAQRIDKLKSVPTEALMPFKTVIALDLLTYRDKLWKSRFTAIPVFKNETINFTDSPAPNDSVFRYAKGTVIARKVKFPDFPVGSRVFLDVSSRSDGDAGHALGAVARADLQGRLAARARSG